MNLLCGNKTQAGINPASVSFPTREAQTFPFAPSDRPCNPEPPSSPLPLIPVIRLPRNCSDRRDRQLELHYRCCNQTPRSTGLLDGAPGVPARPSAPSPTPSLLNFPA